MASHAERVIALEAIAATGLYLAAELGAQRVPQPRRFFVIFLAYALLSGLALVGPNAGELGQALGGLVLLANIAPPKGQPASESPIYKASTALSNLAAAPPWPTQATTPPYKDPLDQLGGVFKGLVPFNPFSAISTATPQQVPQTV